MKVLICWIGFTDLKAARGDSEAGQGPIARAVDTGEFDGFHLLSDCPKNESANYRKWLEKRTDSPITIHQVELGSPWNIDEIWQAATRLLIELMSPDDAPELTYHLSPGAPAMAMVWVLLSKSRFPARLIQSSKYGVEEVQVPFDIYAEFAPLALKKTDDALIKLASGETRSIEGFSSIIWQSPEMERVLGDATVLSARNVPVLILGESGTGKELLAREIHEASPRAHGPFIEVNSGAIPANLAEDEFFGHIKGAYTDARSDKKGLFEMAHNGTLFLDEVGELDANMQVKLLRALQDGRFRPVGSEQSRSVDARIVAATNRNLHSETAKGNFREDLFYRLAVGVLTLPPLRERQGDIGKLVDFMLDRFNKDKSICLGNKPKSISPSGKNLLLQHPWPGNIRELQNSLLRAFLFSRTEIISDIEIQRAFIEMPNNPSRESQASVNIGNGINLEKEVAKFKLDHITTALDATHGNKTAAAKLLGLNSPQTLQNWKDTSERTLKQGNE